MSKIAFLVSGERMFKKIKKYIDIENNISDYIELLKEIDIKSNKIAFVDYIEASESLVDLAKLVTFQQ